MSGEGRDMEQRVLIGLVTRREFFGMHVKKLRELVEIAITCRVK